MPHTLLLADDSGTTRRVIELTFAEQGVRVVCVADGDQAVEKLSTEPPDIVLVATGLPKVDGYELASFVKRQPALSHVPVLLLTGAFDTVDDARLRDSGAVGVLVKPFEPGAVLARVKELLGITSDTPPVPFSTTGQLISQDAPRARAPMGASWQPPPPKQIDPISAAPSVVASPQPEMADAFAALLAAEQGEPVNHHPAIEVNDEVIDRIASRVADQLSHSLLMDHVTRIVSEVAERVVREEIARIRAAAQRKS